MTINEKVKEYNPFLDLQFKNVETLNFLRRRYPSFDLSKIVITKVTKSYQLIEELLDLGELVTSGALKDALDKDNMRIFSLLLSRVRPNVKFPYEVKLPYEEAIGKNNLPALREMMTKKTCSDHSGDDHFSY